MTDFRALCAELLEGIERHVVTVEDAELYEALLDRARAALAEGAGVGPSDEQQKALKELDAWIRERHGEFAEGTILCDGLNVELIHSAILAHPRPIPVAERPWEHEGFCDAKGRCWVFHHSIGVLVQPDSSLGDAVCFPAAAIPLPEASP